VYLKEWPARGEGGNARCTHKKKKEGVGGDGRRSGFTIQRKRVVQRSLLARTQKTDHRKGRGTTHGEETTPGKSVRGGEGALERKANERAAV